MDYVTWIIRGLERTGKTKKGLAEALGGHPSKTTDLLQGKRDLKVHEVQKIADYLGEPPPPFIRSAYVPLIGGVASQPFAGIIRLGTVNAGREIAVPYGAEGALTAFQVEERGMPGLAKEDWVVFCGPRREPPDADQIGELCRCGLATGESVIRFLNPSLYENHFDLIGYDAEPLRAQKVVWAETVLHISTAAGARASVRS